MAKTATKKVRVTAKQVAQHRAKTVKDTSPNWEGCESWGTDQFMSFFRNAMDYYRLEADSKTFKPAVVRWMESIGCAKEDIIAIKKIKDNRINSTMGAIASCLLRGMQPVREDFNGGRDTAEWLRNAIVEAIRSGRNDIEEQEVKETKSTVPQPSIQDRLREAAANMTEEIENAIDDFQRDPESFDPKAFKMLNLLRGRGAKAAHARIIKGFYQRDLDELLELASGNADDQLREGYSHRSRKQIKKLIEFYQEIAAACDMLAQEQKVNRKPRAKKPTDKAKVVAKLKYKKQDDALKLVSINPQDIIGSKELWIYNSKTRKLGKYVAAEYQELGVKGTTITGFDENASICKTLRKPEEKLKEFKGAGKVQLRKFLDDINATDTKMNGRINEEIILLKVV
jgi:hypothetical protein